MRPSSEGPDLISEQHTVCGIPSRNSTHLELTVLSADFLPVPSVRGREDNSLSGSGEEQAAPGMGEAS